MKTYNDLYLSSRNILRQYGIENFSNEARMIVAAASGKSSAELIRDFPLYTSPEIESRTLDYIARRLKGEPLAYVIGAWEFYGLPMYVNQNVLIPRIDTEVIIDAAKEKLIGNKMDARILDLCCGSGCISCAIGHELPASHIVAIDISQSALEVTRKNFAINRISSRSICMQADALSSPPMGLGHFDMIISNPPYIATSEIQSLDPSVKDYEPAWALDGGDDGLQFYRSIIKYWKMLLVPGGYILFEVGEGQAETVSEMLFSAGFSNIETRKDSIPVDRVVIARL